MLQELEAVLRCTKKGSFQCAYPPLSNSLILKRMDCTKRVVQNKAMKIGYARVSTDEQNLDLQIDALKGAGCEKIFTDEGVSGITIERDGLSQAILGVGEGDILVVLEAGPSGALSGLPVRAGGTVQTTGRRVSEPDRRH